MTRVQVVLVSMVVLMGHAVLAQQSVDVGSVSGRVIDPSGAVVPGAAVTARQVDTNLQTAAVTDQDGRFRFPYLRIGMYEVTVSHTGFQPNTHSLTVTAGAAFELPMQLRVGAVQSDVTVTGAATVLEAARSQIAGTVSAEEINALPLNGRSFLDIALLVPGVSPTNVASTQLFPETSAVPGVSLSIASQRNLSNNFIVDGLSANDDAAALSGITFTADAIEQFQVVTSGGQAELGRALGGIINVVTKSGTNRLQGTVYDYFRHDRLTAKNPLLGITLPMTQSQYGGSVGGPMVADRTFFFANAEQRRLDQTGLVTVSQTALDAINAHLNAVGYRGPQVATGVYPNPMDSTNLLGKIDHRVSERDQLSIRYGAYGITAENARGAGGLNTPSASSALGNRDHTIAASNTFTLSARTVLETRAQFGHGNLEAPPTDPIGPAVSIAGVASFGTSSGSPTSRVNNLYQVVNNLSHQTGAHAIRVGADVLHNDDVITYPRSVRGSYTFASLASFLDGIYNTAGFTQTFGLSQIAQTNPNLGFYVQDEWKTRSDLTLNLGVRYDLQFLETVTTDTDNVSPRIGLAWTPFPSRRTVVRGNAGVFYDRMPLRAVANALLSAGNTTDVSQLRQIAVSLSPAQAGAPAFPNILTGVVPTVTLANLTTMDRDVQNASSRQASVEVQQQLGDHSTVSVGYQYLRSLNLLMSVNQNVPSCIASGTNNGCRPNPGYANNSQYSSVGRSNYHGLQVSYLQRPTAWGSYRLSYTLSRSMNNVGEFFFSSPIDALDLAKDWGRSDNDQRHRLVVLGSVQTPSTPATTIWEGVSHGFQLSGMVQAYSPLPLNVTSGVTTVQGTAGRPVVNGAFIERNAGVGSGFFALNMRLSRSFRITGRTRIEVLIEGFNLSNRKNIVTRNNNFGAGAYPTSPSASFGQVTAVGEPRNIQFGLRVRF